MRNKDIPRNGANLPISVSHKTKVIESFKIIMDHPTSFSLACMICNMSGNAHTFIEKNRYWKG